MKRRKLLQRSGLLMLPFVPAMPRSSSEEPEKRWGYTFSRVKEVPQEATIAKPGKYDLTDRSVWAIETSREHLEDRPGQELTVATPRGGIDDSPDPYDFRPLPYSDLEDDSQGYYLDVGFIMRAYV